MNNHRLKNAANIITECQLIVKCPLAGGDLERDPTIEIKGAEVTGTLHFKNGTPRHLTIF